MVYNFSIEKAKILDNQDELSHFRNLFDIPKHNNDDSIYFSGNSLGLKLKKQNLYLDQELNDWGKMAVEGHFMAKTPWISYHKNLEGPTSRLVGAKKSEVVTMNGLSVNLHLLLTSFYNPTKEKFKILCEPHLFPSDLYILKSQIELRGFNPEESILFLPSDENGVVDNDEVLRIINNKRNSIALVFIGGVNYYTGQVFDIKKITETCRKNNIIAGFDLAHAAGNIELNLHKWGVDFAAWCSYKYLNSGPGNVSTIFVHENQVKNKPFRLAGWWGHKLKNRFRLENKFSPIESAEGWQLSNAPVFGMSIYRSSLELFDKIGMKNLIKKRIKLSSYLEEAINSINTELDLKLKIITPGNAKTRGGQLSILMDGDGKAFYNFLRKSGVFLDWRDPNIFRLAVAPIYNSFEDIARFHNLVINAFKK